MSAIVVLHFCCVYAFVHSCVNPIMHSGNLVQLCSIFRTLCSFNSLFGSFRGNLIGEHRDSPAHISCHNRQCSAKHDIPSGCDAPRSSSQQCARGPLTLVTLKIANRCQGLVIYDRHDVVCLMTYVGRRLDHRFRNSSLQDSFRELENRVSMVCSEPERISRPVLSTNANSERGYTKEIFQQR